MENAGSNWIDFFISLAPVGEALVWAAMVVVVVCSIRKPLFGVANAIAGRVGAGDDIETPWGSIKRAQALDDLEHIEPSDAAPLGDLQEKRNGVPVEPEEWAALRNSIYTNSRGVFLTHIIRPSKRGVKYYDIYIFLKRHKSEEYSDIKSAEFFLGHYWGNKVFKESNDGGLIGFSTSAYGPFVCAAKVNFNDGSSSMIHRYIDFEMGYIFKSYHPN